MSSHTFQYTEGLAPPELILGPKQLLPNIVDGIARTRPNSTFARMSKDPTSWEQGIRKITYRALSNAVNGAAAWLVELVGRAEDVGSQPVAYFGLLDAHYQILTLAAIKTGHKVVFPSAMQGVAGLVNFLETVNCSTIVAADSSLSIIVSLQKEQPHIRTVDAPNLEDLLENNFPAMRCAKTFQEARNDPFLVLHTSGSTGKPKPIVYTNDWVAAWASQGLATPPADCDKVEYHYHGIDVFSLTPPAHAGGLLSMLVRAVCHGTKNVYPLPRSPLNMATMMETLKHCDVDVCFCPPIFLEIVALDAELTAFVKSRARMVAYGGGPLSRLAGDILSKHFMLLNMYGTSENGTQSQLIPPGGWRPEYWADSTPMPGSNVEMRPVEGTTDQYEMVVLRAEDPEHDAPVFKISPHLTEWSTGDVFVARDFEPASAKGSSLSSTGKPLQLYSYSHRLSDSITLVLPDQGTLLNKKTINPLQLENALSGKTPIKSALVFGHRRRFPGLLVELTGASPPNDSETASVPDQRQNMLDEVWYKVQKHRTADIDIQKDCIIFTTPDRPMPRSLKGKAQRAQALQLYETDITDLYRRKGAM